MSFKVKRFTVVFFMLVAFATQAYATAFTSNMHTSLGLSSTSVQQVSVNHHTALNNSGCDDASDLACVDAVAESSCCNESAECSPVHCSPLTTCLVYSFCSDLKATPLRFSVNSPYLLTQRAMSLYRPPISH